jgi:hypothetical protein
MNEERSGKCYDKWNISVVICDTNMIFHNGQPSHGGNCKTFEVMTSTLPIGTLGSAAFLLAATLYQGNPDMNHKLWNIISKGRYKCMYNIYTCICRCCWNVATYKWKVHNG